MVMSSVSNAQKLAHPAIKPGKNAISLKDLF
jgi:hypothetical protein